MIQCYFGKDQKLSKKWMIRVMNFGQDRPNDVLKTSYEMVIDISTVNKLTKRILLELKEDGVLLPEFREPLDELLVTLPEPNLIDLISENYTMAHQFLFDFSHRILIELEKNQGWPLHLNPKYQLNTVDEIKIKEQNILIKGKAFIMDR